MKLAYQFTLLFELYTINFLFLPYYFSWRIREGIFALLLILEMNDLVFHHEAYRLLIDFFFYHVEAVHTVSTYLIYLFAVSLEN